MKKTISIIMTVYNGERYLDLAIKSVLSQTYPDFELLIWDDGSTDRSVEIARHFAQFDQRVRIVTAPHQGRARSLKAAIKQTSSPYIGLVDSDDLLAPTALNETAAILDARKEVGLVYTDYQVIDENNKLTGYGQRCRIPYSKERLLVDFMIFHFRLLRRDIYDQVGGINEKFELAQDYDLCLRLSEVTQIEHLANPLYYYRYHYESVSHQKRIEQILAARDAINLALQRRGLEKHYELDLQIVGRYSLRPKG
ncbi:filamentous hemagglutinin outer membrane protein (plasmid) [Tolypothrix tenuis PCC 7101]|uniref:Filamentous hemagglutinin outer membrane protein n=1 Tax=Tolypothrix tenuis PCC 7101 TaxID=231146 RepID=A0A1Z4NB18_9CYAN|nr:glycosyltransferase [Aulosira sp. FACHB-113]BAZ02929.1 filamentous hemagglutinin outer membrane protein [Tolypothrix tenuis PCC 7101]BAZ78148.1 filamentous hemagglutinin outer membrane protein [Aulosira laxa NIES-50]